MNEMLNGLNIISFPKIKDYTSALNDSQVILAV